MPRSRLIASILSAYLVLGLATSSFGVTSYLLIQGSFNGTPQTYKWQVNYNAGQLTTGQDLLNAVFGGALTSTGTYTDDLGDPPYAMFTTSNGSQGATYISTDWGMLLIGLKVDGATALQSTVYDPFWYYNLSGGTDTDSTSYPSALWTQAQNGAISRFLTDGSFDGWNLASYGTPISGSDQNTGTTLVNDPVASSFSGARVINLSATPEPARILLLVAGLTIAAMRRARQRAHHPFLVA